MSLTDSVPVQFRRKAFWKAIMNEKDGLGKESTFDFKYVPTYSQTTEPGPVSSRVGSSFGVEFVGLLGLAIPSLAIGAASYAIFPRVM